MTTVAKVVALPTCDVCQTKTASYDAATKYGPWAYMCEGCFEVHGTGQLGLGLGQRLEVEVE